MTAAHRGRRRTGPRARPSSAQSGQMESGRRPYSTRWGCALHRGAAGGRSCARSWSHLRSRRPAAARAAAGSARHPAQGASSWRERKTIERARRQVDPAVEHGVEERLRRRGPGAGRRVVGDRAAPRPAAEPAASVKNTLNMLPARPIVCGTPAVVRASVTRSTRRWAARSR